VDPHPFNADPDPAFSLYSDPGPDLHSNADPDNSCKNNAVPDPQPWLALCFAEP
jgi:hypothetical protein